MFTYLTALVNPVSFLRCPSCFSPLRHKLHSILWPANINHQRLYCTEETLGNIVVDVSLPDYKPHDPLIPMTIHASVKSHCPVSAVSYPLGDTNAKEDSAVQCTYKTSQNCFISHNNLTPFPPSKLTLTVTFRFIANTPSLTSRILNCFIGWNVNEYNLPLWGLNISQVMMQRMGDKGIIALLLSKTLVSNITLLCSYLYLDHSTGFTFHSY